MYYFLSGIWVIIQCCNLFSLLRYGWFYMHEPKSFGIPPIPYEAAVPGGGNCNLEETLCCEQDKVRVSKESKATDVGNAASETEAQKIDNAAVDPMVN